MMMAHIIMNLLGSLEIKWGEGKPPRFRSPTAVALLGYLVTEARPISRSALTDFFWPDQIESQARGELRRVLHNLSTIVPGCIQVDRHIVRWEASSTCQIDIATLHQLKNNKDLRVLERAAALYKGKFMEGVCLDDCPDFETWLLVEREYWQQQVVQVLQTLVARYSNRGNYEQGLFFAFQLLSLEPWREETRRQVMLLLARSGQRSAALSQYETCCQILADELDVEPTIETITLYQRIKTATGPPHNLPPQPTTFVGRKGELELVCRHMSNPDCRLLVLTGIGGIGKSRLAIEATRLLASERKRVFLHGVVLIPLTGIESADFLVSAIASALKVSLYGQEKAEKQLLNYLRDKELLLLFDNYDHLLPHVGLLASILRQAPDVKLLVTSRERLNLREEWLLNVAELPYPDDSRNVDDTDTLGNYSAVQLFMSGARRIQPQISLASVRQEVIQICRLVQGMPLALELASGWLRHRSCDEVLQELERSLDILVGTQYNIAERHCSLRAVFESSYLKLNPSESRLLAKLSVFRGDFSREAVMAIAGAKLVHLVSLVDKSLLYQNNSGRYQLHELLRRYLAEKLSAMPDVTVDTYDRHCKYYACLLQNSKAANELATVEELSLDMVNVRQAWQWALALDRWSLIRQCAQSLFQYYRLRGPFQEGETVFRDAVNKVRQFIDQEKCPEAKRILCQLLIFWARFLKEQRSFAKIVTIAQDLINYAGDLDSVELEASGYLWWGQALLYQGELKAAQLRLEHVLMLTPEEAIRPQQARSLRNLGAIALRFGNPEARVYFERSLEMFQIIGDRRGEAGTLNNLALIFLSQDDFLRAKCTFERAVKIYQEIGDRWGESLATINLGNTAVQMGSYKMARKYYERVLPCKREIGDREGEGVALVSLSLTYHLLGDNKGAIEYGRRAFIVARRLNYQSIEAYALTFQGHAQLALGRWDEAKIAYEQALTIRQEANQMKLALEPLAGLARFCLALGDLSHALDYAEDILAIMLKTGVNGTEEPLRIYLTSYQVLNACGDARATNILDEAFQLLQERASRIGNEQNRSVFLEKVAVHRQILKAHNSGHCLN
jgi:predicted ATPase/DNA-binding SARP family transcriptional activator